MARVRLREADPALANYAPAWLRDLAADVTLEGSIMNGAVQGADAVRSLVGYVRTLYECQEFHFAGPVGNVVLIYVQRGRGRRTTSWSITGLAGSC
jgi:hypothetical protein